MDSEFCRNIVESAKRQKSQPVRKKKPITTDIIRSILDVHNKKDANLKNLRIAARALCSLAFAGFFHYHELCNIVPKHIEFHSDYIRIFVPRSKTDVYREGISSLLVHPGLSTVLWVFYKGIWIYLVLTYAVLSLYLDRLFFTVVVLAIP